MTLLKCSSGPVVLENDPPARMFSHEGARVVRQEVEPARKKHFSFVDKFRQSSHSLFNANVCEMFHEHSVSEVKVQALLTIIIRSE
ncbi:hypothetical protein AO268_03970 [Pseudomonas sp. ICMP 8385]|nr:hypothetical protein AO268_03970 [Pseudomonas sp. ICMP 8385]